MKTKSILVIACLTLALLMTVGTPAAQAQDCCCVQWVLGSPFYATATGLMIMGGIVSAPFTWFGCASGNCGFWCIFLQINCPAPTLPISVRLFTIISHIVKQLSGVGCGCYSVTAVLPWSPAWYSCSAALLSGNWHSPLDMTRSPRLSAKAC